MLHYSTVLKGYRISVLTELTIRVTGTFTHSCSLHQVCPSVCLSVCPSVRMHATYSPNILRRHENSLCRKLPTVYSHYVITQEVYGPVSEERSNAQSIGILLASIKTSVVYMPLTLSKLKAKINVFLWLIKCLATRCMGHQRHSSTCSLPL